MRSQKNLTQDKFLKDVHFNFITEKTGWIIRRIVDELIPITSSYRIIDGRKVKFARILLPRHKSRIIVNYFATYTWFDRKFIGSGFNVCLLTHLNEDNKDSVAEWRYAISNSNLLIAISQFAYDQALKYKCDPGKLRLIAYGIDHEVYHPTCNLLIIGKAHKRKGKALLREIIDSKKLNPAIQVRSNSSQWGVDSFSPDLNKLPFLYDWCDALLVLSELEGGHTPTLEALAKGKPVITTPTGYSYSELDNIKFEINNLTSAISTINDFAEKILINKSKFSNKVTNFNWDSWRKKNFQEIAKFINLD
jgi:glycosyltransferase involved in cell wall biosynthesis